MAYDASLAKSVGPIISVLFGLIDSIPTVNGDGTPIGQPERNALILDSVMVVVKGSPILTQTGYTESQFRTFLTDILAVVTTFKANYKL